MGIMLHWKIIGQLSFFSNFDIHKLKYNQTSTTQIAIFMYCDKPFIEIFVNQMFNLHMFRQDLHETWKPSVPEQVCLGRKV